MKRYNRLYGLKPVTRIGVSVLALAASFSSFAFSESDQSGVIEYTATFDYGSLNVEERSGSDGELFSRLMMPGLDNENTAGAPDIPVRYLSFLVPSYSKDYSVSLISCDMEETRELNHDVMPIQEDHDMNTCDPGFTLPDMSIYNDRSDIEVKVIGERFFEGWQHLVNVAIRPIAYNCQDKKIRCYNNVKIRLEYASCQADEMESAPVFPPDPVYSPILEQLVVNPPAELSAGPQKLGGMTTPLRDRYIIVTTEELKSSLEELAVWKRQKGYTAEIVTMESILSTPGYAVNPADSIVDEAAALRKWLKNKYETSGHYFLLLAGDSRMGDIPVRKYYYVTRHGTDDNVFGERYIPSDMYFVDFSPNLDKKLTTILNVPGSLSISVNEPFNPVLPVGRLMCKDGKQVSNYIRKLKLYEAWPGKGRTEYLTRGVSSYQQNAIDSITNKRMYRSIFDALNNYFVVKELLDTIRINSCAARHPTGAEVINESSKAGLLCWEGHGTTGSIITAGNENIDYNTWRFIQPLQETTATGLNPHTDPNNSLDLLGNDYSPAVAYSMSCFIMPFDVPYDYLWAYEHFGSAFTVAGRYGGVAFLGNTRAGWFNSSNELEYYFGQTLIKNRKAGVAEYLSKINIPRLFTRAAYYTHNLIGDPEFEIWLGEPAVNRYVIENSDVGYKIKGSNLLGCVITSYDGIQAIRSDKVSSICTSVDIDFNRQFPSNNPSDMMISVWKQGCLPYMELCADNVTLKDISKTYSMPFINISPSKRNPCKFNLADNGRLKLISATDITSDSAVSINGGTLILEGENVKITGTNKFSGGKLTVNAETVTFDGEMEIEGCVVDINCK